MVTCVYCKRSAVLNERKLHAFPKCEKAKRKWIEFMGKDPDQWIPAPRAYLCSDHFDVSCYSLQGTRVGLEKGREPTEIYQYKDSNHVKKLINSEIQYILEDLKTYMQEIVDIPIEHTPVN